MNNECCFLFHLLACLCLTFIFYLSSLRSSYSNLIFLILKCPKLASCFSLLLWTWKNSSQGLCYSFFLYSLCHTDCSLFILFFFTVLKFRWNLCLIILIPFSPDFFYCLCIIYFISFLTVHIQKFSEYTVCGIIKKIKSILAYAFTRLRKLCIAIV